MPASGFIASACRPRAESAAASSRRFPAQLGLGTFSPPLDAHGNSVRGLKICEALSTHFGLHMLNRTGDVRTSIIADYDIGGITSRRSRLPRDQQILEDHHDDVRVIELVGAHSFATIDYVSRRLAEKPAPLLIIDFRRVAAHHHRGRPVAGGYFAQPDRRPVDGDARRYRAAARRSGRPIIR